ncbi:Reverse transcriptase [Theobroma cacao]|nr:Reverse transcriptase [Theobroma cacao]
MGIIHEITAPYTPEQNGVAERKNRALTEMVNALLSNSGEGDPQTYEEAMKSRDASFWKEAIQDEMDPIMGNKTWKLVDLPPSSKPIGSRIATIKVLIALASVHKMVIHWMDIKTTFLNGELDEEVYMEQLEGFVFPSQERKVCKLVKSLYGLKQEPKQWHQKFDEVVLANGYKINQSDKCVYSKFHNGKGVIICLYVDDMLIFGTDIEQVEDTKWFLSKNFDMKDMGMADVILGIRIIRDNNGLTLSQSHYIEKIVMKYGKSDYMPMTTPYDSNIRLVSNKDKPMVQNEYAKVIGSLMYAMVYTRSDIAFAIEMLSQFTSNPSKQHWHVVHKVLSWIFTIGEGVVSWGSKKQSCQVDSTMATEFIALASVTQEAKWLRDLLYEIPLRPKLMAPILIHYDNEATISKAYNQAYNGKSQYIGL